MIIQTEAGQKLEVPDGSTPAQIDEVIGHFTQQNASKTPDIGQVQTIADNAAQGATFGLGDEAKAGIGAGMDYFGDSGARLLNKVGLTDAKVPDRTIGDLYNQNLGQARSDLKTEMQQRPVLSIASNLGGGLVTGGLGAGTAAGGAVGNSLRTGQIAGRQLGLLGKIAAGSGAGAAAGAAYGLGSGEGDINNRLDSAGSGAITGGLLGGALPAVSGLLGAAKNAVIPAADEGLADVAQLAQKHKIPLSLDQVSNSPVLNNLQKVSQELPLSGAGGFRKDQMGAFNKALLNTVGVNGTRITPTVMDTAFNRVGSKFDDLGAGQTFDLNGLVNPIDNIAASGVNQSSINDFKRIANGLLDKTDLSGNITGEALATQRQKINELARNAGDYETKGMLRQLEGSIIDTLTSSDPKATAAFNQTKQQYKNLLAIEPLARKAKGGNINPAGLQAQVDKVYGRASTRGNAGDIGDLAQVGYQLLPKLGGSDTAQKALYMGAAGGGALANPLLTAGLLATNRLGQKGINQNQALVNLVLHRAGAQNNTGGLLSNFAKRAALTNGGGLINQ